MGPTTIGHIAKNYRVHLSGFTPKVGDGCLSREFLTVLPESRDLAALTHSASVYLRSAELADMIGVWRPESIRDQRLEGTTDYLLSRIPENPLRALVEEDDLLILVDADDRIRGYGHDSREDCVGNRFSDPGARDFDHRRESTPGERSGKTRQRFHATPTEQ